MSRSLHQKFTLYLYIYPILYLVSNIFKLNRCHLFQIYITGVILTVIL